MVWAGDGVGRVGHDGRDFKKKIKKKKNQQWLITLPARSVRSHDLLT